MIGRISHLRHSCALALGALSLTGCALEPQADQASLRGQTLVTVEAVTRGYSITSVTIEAQPANVTTGLTTNPNNGSFTGLLVLPVGVQTLTARAYVDLKLVGQGSAEVTIVANTTANVEITILDATGPEAQPDHGPAITSLVTVERASVGQTVSFNVTAVDPDGDSLSYTWADDCATSTFSAPDAASTDWSSTEIGACNVTITVSANGLSTSRSFAVAVFAAGTGGASITGRYVPNPDIRWFNLSGRGYYCDIHRHTDNATCAETVFPTQRISVHFEFLTGADDIAPSVTLSDNCGGTSTLQFLLSSSAYFQWTAPSVPAVCLLTAHVTDEGLSDSFSVAVVSTGCLDDALEHNDDSANAYSGNVSGILLYSSNSKTVPDLYAHDEDWYLLEVVMPPPGAVLHVTASASEALPLALYNSPGTQLLSSGDGSLVYTPAALSEYTTFFLLRVSPGVAALTCSAGYSLTMQVTGS